MNPGLMRLPALLAGLTVVVFLYAPRILAADAPAAPAPAADLPRGIAPVEMRPAEGEIEDTDFPACATICQRRLDASLTQCSGYRNRGEGAARASLPANCRETLGAIFQSCVTRCHERYPGNRARYR